MATVKSLTDELRRQQLSRIDSRYRSDIEEYDREQQRTEREYFSSASNAYIEAMEELRDLPQQLAALGLWGGASAERANSIKKEYETALAQLRQQLGYDTEDYRAARSRREEQWKEELNELNLKNEISDAKQAGSSAALSAKASGQSGKWAGAAERGDEPSGGSAQNSVHGNAGDPPTLDPLDKIIEYLNDRGEKTVKAAQAAGKGAVRHYNYTKN